MRLTSLVFALFTIAAISAGCATPQPPAPADNRAADEKTLRDTDMAWSNAATSLDGFLTYYADDVMVLPPNEAIGNGKEAARKILGELYKAPGFSLKWQSGKVEVARSGDLGYVQGTYDMSMNDPSGKPIMDHGKYLEVWRKQADGSWKCIIDTFNSDLPPVPPPPAK